MTRDLIGQQLGDYRLVSSLGHGGFAEVYLGEHVRLSMSAAIKVLHTHLSTEEIQGFEQEAKTIAKLIHPHIVRILNFDVSNGIPFLVMDYCPDGTLRQRHSKGECVPLATVITYVKQVADALQYAHDQKIIHRDIKPANMLIGQRDAILLSDFGIASTAHSTHSMRTQTFAGTAPYMAPEQIKLHPRRESDQYALAIVTYQWLCGELPFIGTPEEIAIKHLAVEPPSLCQKLPNLSASVEKVVLKALAKDPKERFPTVQDFAMALEHASLIKPLAVVPPQPNTAPSQPTPPLAFIVPTPPVTPTPAQIKVGTPVIQPLPPNVAARPIQTETHPSTVRPPMPKQPPSSHTVPRSASGHPTRRHAGIGLITIWIGTVGAGFGAIIGAGFGAIIGAGFGAIIGAGFGAIIGLAIGLAGV
jgi:serine/threonine protein kinase